MAYKICPNCGTQQPEDYMFCAECGTKLADVPVTGAEPEAAWAQQPDPVRVVPAAPQVAPARPAPSVAPQPPRPAPVPQVQARPAPAVAPQPAPRPAPVQQPVTSPDRRPGRRIAWSLVHLSRAGGTNVPYEVPDDGLFVGRQGCGICFPDDRTLSERHAMVSVGDRGLVIEDAGSVNGLFQKITTDHILVDGDVFVCGDSVFRFSSEVTGLNAEDYRLYASPDETCPAGTVTKILAGGADGQVYPVGRRAVVIGREVADISCPEDRYMSRVHASVEPVSSGLALKDKQSRNGTYIKTPGSITVRDGDVILVGRQLLKVEAKSL